MKRRLRKTTCPKNAGTRASAGDVVWLMESLEKQRYSCGYDPSYAASIPA